MWDAASDLFTAIVGFGIMLFPIMTYNMPLLLICGVLFAVI